MDRSKWFLAAGLALCSAAGGAGAAHASNAHAPSVPAAQSALIQRQPTMTNEELDTRTQAAVAILARRLAVDENQITVLTAERVTWPDGAAGCPREGMGYTHQALVPGYRIVLEHQVREYHYHGHAGSDPFFCARPESPNRWIMDR